MTHDTQTRVVAATDAAAGGEPYITAPVQYDAIVLAGFGGPEGQDDVIPFLRNVTGGRGIPEERLEEVAVHYRHYDGVSPINGQNRALQAALDTALHERGIDLPVLWGNRNWAPYLKDVLVDAHDRGYRNLLALATSAYSSYSSCRQYREDFAAALAETELDGELHIDKIRQYFDHPGFIQPFVDGVTDAFATLTREHPELDRLDDITVLFTTHSVPMGDANLSGPSEDHFGEGGAYAAQHRAVAETVVTAVQGRLALAAGETIDWQLVFQSRSGPPSQPWLEPDINDVIRELPKTGKRAVIIVPIGFVSDHMEVLWDLDNEATDTAAEVGIVSLRVATPGHQHAFVEGLVDLIQERLEGRAVSERAHETELGPWYDVCRSGCCASARFGCKRAIAGLEP